MFCRVPVGPPDYRSDNRGVASSVANREFYILHTVSSSFNSKRLSGLVLESWLEHCSPDNCTGCETLNLAKAT